MFHRLKEAINNLASAIGNQQKTRKKNREKVPGAMTSPAKDDDAQHARTYREKGHSIQQVIAVATIGAFISASIYAYLAWRQVSVMNQTYGEIQRQTRAAEQSADSSDKSVLLAQKTERDSRLMSEKQLKAAIAQYQSDQRAWVALTGFRVQLSPKAAIIPNLATTDEATAGFQNSGHTPARDVRGIIGFGFKDRKHIMNSDDARWLDSQISIQRKGIGKSGRQDWWFKGEAGNSYRPWGKLVMGEAILQPISLGVIGPGVTVVYTHPEDWHAGENIQFEAFFFGELSYQDNLHTRHTTRFCVYRPDNVGDKFDYCPVFNAMD
jgi:hypothetical protein